MTSPADIGEAEMQMRQAIKQVRKAIKRWREVHPSPPVGSKDYIINCRFSTISGAFYSFELEKGWEKDGDEF